MEKNDRYINEYHDFELGSPACAPGELQYGAEFKLDRDISELFPYINAVNKTAKYLESPLNIVFTLDGIKCAIYPDTAIAARFDDEYSARKFIVRLIDYLNDIYDTKDSIVPDHKVYKAVAALSIFKLLPRTNCSECGYPSCMAFATALSNSETLLERCPALKNPEDDNAKMIAALFNQ